MLHKKKSFFFFIVIRRLENDSGSIELFTQIINKNLLLSQIQRISCVPRAREIRLFHDMVEDVNSDFYFEYNIVKIKDLLNRCRESFSNKAES